MVKGVVENALTLDTPAHLIARMSSLRSILATLACAGLLAGCGQTNLDKHISCQTTTDCPTTEQIDHTVVDGTPPAECCNNVCVIPSTGCDSLYRYVTTKHDVGMCVVDPMCPVPPDMAVPVDMSRLPDAG